MTWLFVIVVILVVGAGALLAVGRLGELPPVEPDLRPDVREGEPSFDVVVRGYRMDEVDAQIAGMQDAIAGMQDEIDRLRAGQNEAGA